MSVTGLPGQGPVRVGLPIADLCAGIFAAYGIVVALLERERSGKGQWLHTSLLEAQIYMMDFQTARWTDRRRDSRAGGQLPSDEHSHGRLPDAGRPHQHRGLRRQDLGALLPHAGRPRMDRRRALQRQGRTRSVNRDWLNAEIEKKLAAHTSDYWIEQLNREGVACGRINNLKEVFEEPQVQHLGMVKTVVSKHYGRAAPGGPAGHAHAHAFDHRARRAASAASTPRRCSPRSATAPRSSPA